MQDYIRSALNITVTCVDVFLFIIVSIILASVLPKITTESDTVVSNFLNINDCRINLFNDIFEQGALEILIQITGDSGCFIVKDSLITSDSVIPLDYQNLQQPCYYINLTNCDSSIIDIKGGGQPVDFNNNESFVFNCNQAWLPFIQQIKEFQLGLKKCKTIKGLLNQTGYCNPLLSFQIYTKDTYIYNKSLNYILNYYNLKPDTYVCTIQTIEDNFSFILRVTSYCFFIDLCCTFVIIFIEIIFTNIPLEK